jgi:hypothetical protein
VKAYGSILAAVAFGLCSACAAEKVPVRSYEIRCGATVHVRNATFYKWEGACVTLYDGSGSSVVRSATYCGCASIETLATCNAPCGPGLRW